MPTKAFQKRAAKHGYSCELCRPDDKKGRVKPAVTTVSNVNLCADHLMTLALIVTAASARVAFCRAEVERLTAEVHEDSEPEYPR